MPPPIPPLLNTPTNGYWFPLMPSDQTVTKTVKKEIAANTANVPFLPGVQPCPLLLKAPANDPSNKVCNFNALKVTKPGRNFDLILTPTTPSNKRTLEIVAGYKSKPATTVFYLDGSVGPCPEIHNNKRSFDSGSGNFKIVQNSENNLKVELVSNSLMRLTPWDVARNRYTISANRCGHARESATIVVYPDLEFDVYVGYDFGEQMFRNDKKVTIEETNNNKNQRTKTETFQTIKISKGVIIGGSLKYDGTEHKIETTFKKTIETVQRINKLVERAKVALDTIKGNQEAAIVANSTVNPKSFGILWPKIKLHLGGAWKEDSGKPTVSYEGKIKFEGAPLFGLRFQWNITSTVLKSIPGGVTFDVIKDRLKVGLLDLIIKSGVELAADISIFIKNKKIDRVTGGLDAKIPIIAELTAIKADVDAWFVHATIEYKMGVSSGFRVGIKYNAREEGMVCTGGMLDFVVWWSGGTQYGLSSSDTAPNKYAQTSKTSNAITAKHILYTKKFEGEHDFFKYDIKNHKFI